MCGWDWGTDIFLLLHFHSFKFKQPQVASGYLIDQGRAQRFSPCLVRTCSPGWFCRTLRSSVTSACSLWFWHWARSQLCTFHLSLCGWLASLFPSSHKCWPWHPSELNQPLAQPGIASSDPLAPWGSAHSPQGDVTDLLSCVTGWCWADTLSGSLFAPLASHFTPRRLPHHQLVPGRQHSTHGTQHCPLGSSSELLFCSHPSVLEREPSQSSLGPWRWQILASHSSRVLSNSNNSKYFVSYKPRECPIPIFLYWNIQIFIYWNIPIFQLLPDNFLHSAATQTYHKSNVPIPKSKSTVTKLSPYSKETDLIWLQRLQQLAQLLWASVSLSEKWV